MAVPIGLSLSGHCSFEIFLTFATEKVLLFYIRNMVQNIPQFSLSTNSLFKIPLRK